MTSTRALETAYVLALFGGYLALWRIKRASQTRATGQDPEVLARATDPVQRFFVAMTRVLTGAIVVIIATHALELDWAGIAPLPALDSGIVNHVGLVLGLAGLAICWTAQRTMGDSWRVGIDEANRTALVTAGIYRLVRNPTYLGLYLVNAGLWLIWPTCAVAMFALAFYLMLEVQVRCEERHLLGLHDETYRDYMQRTWRYVPWVY